MTVVSLLVLVALLAGNAFFVAAEFALVSTRADQIEPRAEAGSPRAVKTLAAMRNVSEMMAGAQLGITVTNLGIGFLAEPAIAALIVGPLTDAGLSPVAARSTSVVLALVLATGLTMIFGELVPKNLAISKPLATARAVSGFQRSFTRALAWPIRLFNGNANRIVRALGVEPQEELASTRSPEELAGLVRHSAERGALAAATAELVERSFAFGDRRAHDLLMLLLGEHRPGDAVLSEEGKDDKARLRSDRVWIVDPLDGTREFSEPPRDDWAVHVALW